MNYYATVNPHLKREVRPQVRFSVNSWCGNRIIGPVYIEGNLNAAIKTEYLNTTFLRKCVGTRGFVRWPPRLPCLNRLEYFFMELSQKYGLWKGKSRKYCGNTSEN